MIELVSVAVGGALGAVSRYGISSYLAQRAGTGFAWGTLVANVLGCLLLGFLGRAWLDAAWMSPGLRLAITTGFLGALTTFSTFSYETLMFLQTGRSGAAALNVAANLVLGGGATLLGLQLASAVAAGPAS